jgi:hypothetical protein
MHAGVGYHQAAAPRRRDGGEVRAFFCGFARPRRETHARLRKMWVMARAKAHGYRHLIATRWLLPAHRYAMDRGRPSSVSSGGAIVEKQAGHGHPARWGQHALRVPVGRESRGSPSSELRYKGQAGWIHHGRRPPCPRSAGVEAKTSGTWPSPHLVSRLNSPLSPGSGLHFSLHNTRHGQSASAPEPNRTQPSLQNCHE